MFGFHYLGLAAIFVLGVYWCYEVIGRFKDDLEELREVKETARKAAIIFVWALTLIIAIALIGFSIVMISGVVSFVRGRF